MQTINTCCLLTKIGQLYLREWRFQGPATPGTRPGSGPIFLQFLV